MDKNLDWIRKWSESKSTLKQDIIKKFHLYVTSEIILASSQDTYHRHMPLQVYNSLPGSDIRIGTRNHKELPY